MFCFFNSEDITSMVLVQGFAGVFHAQDPLLQGGRAFSRILALYMAEYFFLEWLEDLIQPV
jgi:hypothetical protein